MICRVTFGEVISSALVLVGHAVAVQAVEVLLEDDSHAALGRRHCQGALHGLEDVDHAQAAIDQALDSGWPSKSV